MDVQPPCHSSPQPPAEPTTLARLLRTLKWCAIVLLLALLVLRITNIAERLAYWPSRLAYDTPSAYQDITFTTPDGLTLYGWFMPARGVPPGEQAPAILHAHGNAGNIASHESFSSYLPRAGFHVLLFDYRGYGRSQSGRGLSRELLAVDTRAALDYLLSRPDVDPDRVGVLGVSLGAVFALRTAAEDPRVSAAVTVSAFATWRGVARDASPIGHLLIRAGLDPADSAARLGPRPLLIMHGLDDAIVDPRHATILHDRAQAAGVNADLHLYEGGDHNALLLSDSQARADLIAFFQSHLGQPDR